MSAFATNTRLMGVLSIYAQWRIERNGIESDFHQFFYFDSEEFGFERYDELVDASIEELEELERSMMNGLGGKRIDLKEWEVVAILQFYIDKNLELNLPLPKAHINYNFIYESKINPSEQEKYRLFAKLCTPISNEYAAINYFLMRSFGRDLNAIKYLRDEAFNEDPFEDFNICTFCKNTIETKHKDGETIFLCESLIEDPSSQCYKIVVSEIWLNDTFKVAYCNIINSFAITPIEAALKLSQSEFITVYKINFDEHTLEEHCSELLSTSMPSPYGNGTLYMIFNRTNQHVEQPVFRLNNDVKGLIFISKDENEMIFCSSTIMNIHNLEHQFLTSVLGNKVAITGKYEFKEPVFYEFINSDIGDFDTFLALIQDFDK